MENIFVEFLPPWVETGLQPAFYDKESGTVLQQTARMYARVNMLIRMFNKLSKNTKEEVERFEEVVDTRVTNFENSVNETVADYIEQFNQLHDYVHDYFDNLDVQEEINNKLDQMVEDGVLQEIITTYIQSNVAWTFDNVAEMKLATNLTDDSFAQTIGFYSANDKGGALYKIRAKTIDDTVDEMTLIGLYDNTLVAELVKTDIMNVKQFGAKGDETNDDTLAIQTALNFNSNIEVPSGTYMVNAITHINLNDNNKLTLSNDATIKAITNDANNYAVLVVSNVKNVEICGGTIQGDRTTHTGSTGEWGHCISIANGSNNVHIHDVVIKDGWGDGLYVANGSNINTNNLIIDNNRRNGMSIISAHKFSSLNDYISNTHGTSPEAGVDIEPNTADEYIDGITFENLRTENNHGKGLSVFIAQPLTNPIKVNVINHHDKGSHNGCGITKNKSTKGLITFIDPFYEDSYEAGIAARNCYDSECKIKIIRPYIINCNTSNNTGALWGPGIAGYIDSDGDATTPFGNFEIYEPFIEANSGSTVSNSIAFRNQTSATLRTNRIKIINPLNYDNKYPYIDQDGTNIFFQDDYNTLTFVSNNSFTIQRSQFYSRYTNSSTTSANRIFTIPDGVLNVGRVIKIQNLNSSHTLALKLPTTDYCRGLSATVSPTITLGSYGDFIAVRKIADNEWCVDSVNCTPTVS